MLVRFYKKYQGIEGRAQYPDDTHVLSTIEIRRTVSEYKSATILNGVLYVVSVFADNLVYCFELDKYDAILQNELIDIFYPILV